ncbi:hypothetical protein Tco_1267301 [Tanacetum coccineum]
MVQNGRCTIRNVMRFSKNVSIDGLVIRDGVGVRRMEEIDVEVLFDAWKKIYVMNSLVSRATSRSYMIELVINGPFSIQMRSKEQKSIFTCYLVLFLSLVVKHSFKGMQDTRNGCEKPVKNARSKRL